MTLARRRVISSLAWRSCKDSADSRFGVQPLLPESPWSLRYRQRAAFRRRSQRKAVMTHIIAGVFDDNSAADRTISRLHDVGFADDDIDRFAVSAPGRHHRLPLGGDQDADEGARGSEMGAVGGAVGAVAGLVASPLIGPVAIAGGFAAGAYAGSLAGAVRSLGAPVERGDAADVVRQAGVMVAVHVGSTHQEDAALGVLRGNDARTVEWADGLWRHGHWIDFDPVEKPRRIEVASTRRRASQERRRSNRGPRGAD
jgi:hypothetical protein